MIRAWVVGGVGGMLLASMLLARPGVVKTRQGQLFDGDVTEQQDQIIISRGGIRTTLPKRDVRSITWSDSINAEYEKRLAKLTQYDVPGRVTLAQWLFENKQYDLAEQVLQEAQHLQPHNPQVHDMLVTVERQRELELREQRKHQPLQFAAADNSARPPTRPATRAATRPSSRFLTPEEINLVRQAEWQQGQPMRVRFEGDVRRRYVAREGIDPRKFNSLPPAQQAWAILQRGTDDMRKQVILGDPPVMLTFRKVDRSIVSQCANCHNSRKPEGSFVLVGGDEEKALYTNFVILQKYVHKEGDRQYWMIDRERPQDSLLAQFSLPPDIGQPPHPTGDRYAGVVRNRNNPNYKVLEDWIASLTPVTPDYGDLDVTGSGATTRPAANQRTGATPAPAGGLFPDR